MDFCSLVLRRFGLAGLQSLVDNHHTKEIIDKIDKAITLKPWWLNINWMAGRTSICDYNREHSYLLSALNLELFNFLSMLLILVGYFSSIHFYMYNCGLEQNITWKLPVPRA